MKTFASALIAVSLIASATADTLVTLDDFDTTTQGLWPHSKLVEDVVHNGRRALQWDVASRPTFNAPHFNADWTEFDELRFWAYLPEPVDFKIPIVFVSSGGYYITDWRLDWSGWKHHRFRLAECARAHDPEGWHNIKYFGFRAQGYGQDDVPEDLTIIFDEFTLHSPHDLKPGSVDAVPVDVFIARERAERMRQLKKSGNPYYQSVYDQCRNIDGPPNTPENIESSWAFAGQTTKALQAAWAASFGDSPLKGNQTLIDYAVTLIDFCLQKQQDGSWFYSQQWQERADPNSDRFALGPLMDAIYWLRRLPDMENHWQRWQEPLKELVDFQYTHWGQYDEMGFTNNIAWGSSAGAYPNQDVFHLYEMALAHKFWGDDKYRQSAEETLQALWDHLLPDGGLNYIGPETEIPTYHDLNILWIARYYRLTGDDSARELLANTVDYYPLTYSNEGRPEYYTDCWWKHYWAGGKACGPEIIAGITGDGRNKWLANRLLERRGTGSTYQAIYAGMFYRDDVQPRQLADNYIKLDRNIGGPRGRFGSWYFAGVTGGGARDTFAGAMVCEPDRPDPLNGAFMAANIEVALEKDGRRDRTHLYISGHDDITDIEIGENAAALGARYSPRKPYINSVEGREVPPTPWQATQVWLFTKYGLVGLVELEATEEQTVPWLGGELRFGPKQPLTEDDDGVFHCGAITMKLLDHNFPKVEAGPARPGYARHSSSHYALMLTTDGDSYHARPGAPLRYVACIAPEGNHPIDELKTLRAPSIWGFELSVATRKLAVAFNPGDDRADITLTGDAPWRGRGVDSRNADRGVTVTIPGATTSIIAAERPNSR